MAVNAQAYYDGENPTIAKYEKIIYDMKGLAHKDMWTANHKIKSQFFRMVVDQENSYLLSNGVTLRGKGSKERLGKDFDQKLSKAAEKAIIGGTAFVFWNLDHLEVFGVIEFAPLYDEENGALMAGIRYWQVADNKPLRCTLYELDGFTEYIKRSGEDMEEMAPKRPYIIHTTKAEAESTEIYDGENYPTFPIVPLKYNDECRSELCGKQNTVDALDLAKSSMVNNVDEGNLIYWALTNCGGMDYTDAERFLQTVKMTHVAFVDGAEDGAKAEPHAIEAPYQGTQITVDMLEKTLYHDFQAIDTGDETLNSSTATGIKFRYAALDLKCDKLERQVTEFLHGIFALAGVDDEPTYTRSKIINTSEEMQTLMLAAPYLDDEYITTKSLTLMGDGDMAEEILKRKAAEAVDRFSGGPEEEEETEDVTTDEK